MLHLLGLSLALAVFYLFMTQVRYNNTYNHNVRDYERTYRLELEQNSFVDTWGVRLPRPTEILVRDVPHVEATVCRCKWASEQVVECNGNSFRLEHTIMGMNGLNFFGQRLLQGNIEDWQNESTVILTESEAKRLYGHDNPVGKRIKDLSHENTYYTVVGVCEDFPDNSMLKNGIYTTFADSWLANEHSCSWFFIYVRLDDAEHKEEVEQAILRKMRETIWTSYTDDKTFEEEIGVTVRLHPIADTYFSGITEEDCGNRTLVIVLLMASVFILLVALLNFTNFCLAEIPTRIHGLNTRRVLGASVGNLRWKLVQENLLLSGIALAVAVLFIVAFQHHPACMRLVSGSVAFGHYPALFALTAGAAILIGGVATGYPAYLATSFTPAMALKGNFGLSPHGKRLRIGMVFVQFVIALVLTSYLLVMHDQSHYIFTCDYGFNKEEVLFSYDLSHETLQQTPYIRGEFEKLPFVESVSFGSGELGDTDLFMKWARSGKEAGQQMMFTCIPVDAHYLSTMNLPIVEGRNFNSTDTKGAFIVNQAMMKQYEWLKVGEPIGNWGEAAYNIVGVCADFKLHSMRVDDSQTAVGFILMGPDMASWGNRCTRMLVRISAGYDKVEAKRQLTDLLNRLDHAQDNEFRFLDESLQTTYENEFRFIAQVRAFTLVCISIILIGVLCLTMFETEYRRKEIALRKIMGSTETEILMLFARRYALPLVAAFVLSLLPTYALCEQWLQNFAMHTPIRLWVFPLAFCIVGAVVMLTVLVQSWHTATMNPVDSIRTE